VTLGKIAERLNLRRRLRMTRVRVVSQLFFFVAFLLAVWATWTSRLGGYPVSRLLEMDPLVTLSTALATGYVYKFLGWGLLVLGLTLLFGRVFCNWICPYGTLHQLTGWLFNIRKHRDRWKTNRYRPIYFLKYGILIVFLIMAALGSLQIGLLDPICLMYRSLSTAFAPASDLLVGAAGEELGRVGIWPGISCGCWYDGMEKSLLVSVTERHTREDIDSLASGLEAVISAGGNS